jgi:hypothetical protein
VKHTSVILAIAWGMAVRVLAAGDGAFAVPHPPPMNEALAQQWLEQWEQNILKDAGNRYCGRETGEEIGWLVSPFLNGFYYGYLATHDPKWVGMLANWADSWIRRGVKEPDGYVGWPKKGTGGRYSEDLDADSLLGEAMALRPIVLMAGEILKTPALKQKYGPKAESYIKLAERTFDKWDSRSAWREVKDGGLWVVPPFGLDGDSGRWTAGYEHRREDGFSNPANKQNLIACWMIALYDVTKKPIYRERAEKWWRLMKARLRVRDDRYYVWNYWDPAGPWDYKPDGAPKHWIGVHPKGGYYAVDVEGMVTAYEHGLVFKKQDIDRLIATNRDFMWDKEVAGAKFKRIDGEQADPRWPDTPGVLWTALVAYDATLRNVFESNHKPDSWGGLSATPRYLAVFRPASADQKR